MIPRSCNYSHKALAVMVIVATLDWSLREGLKYLIQCSAGLFELRVHIRFDDVFRLRLTVHTVRYRTYIHKHGTVSYCNVAIVKSSKVVVRNDFRSPCPFLSLPFLHE